MAEKFSANYSAMEGLGVHRVSYEHRVSTLSIELNDAAEYTFTDRELQEVLGFVELMNNTTTPNDVAAGLELIGLPKTERADNGGDTFVTPLGLPAGVAGLQFQPHYRRVSTDGNQAGFAAGLPPSLLPMANARAQASSVQHGSSSHQQAFSGLPAPINIPKLAPPISYKSMEPPDSPTSMKEGGNHKPSHGASEKQRRDKINAMIDQLRRLVPPPHNEKGDKGAKGGDNGDGKRSKFVVLQNTISAIHSLNARVVQQDAEIQRLHAMLAAAQSSQHHGAGAAEAHHGVPHLLQAPQQQHQQHHHHQQQQQQQQAPYGNGGSGGAHGPFADDSERPASGPAARANSAETTGSDSSNGDRDRDRLAMPNPPSGQSVPGVEVDMGPDHCYLKVTCPDRRGLLADVLHALRTLPLEITRAAITTGPDGFATDIFELKQTFHGTEKEMTAEEIQAAVEARLKEAEEQFKEECQDFLGKRKKRAGSSSAN